MNYFTLQEVQKESDICKSFQKFLTTFYNRVYGEFFRVGWDEKVGKATGLWQDFSQKIILNNYGQDIKDLNYEAICEIYYRDGQDIDRYKCLKFTSCFTFFHFYLYKSVNIGLHLVHISERSRSGFLLLAIVCINYLMNHTQSSKYWKY